MVGDPGFFGSLFGGVKRLGRAAFDISPVGKAFKFASTAFARPQTPSVFQAPTGLRGSQINPVIGTIATSLGAAAGTALVERAFQPSASGCPRGTHLNKSDYFLKDGTFVAAGSRFVTNRTRNPYNKRAATRAASRLKSLGKGMKTIKKSVNAAASSLK